MGNTAAGAPVEVGYPAYLAFVGEYEDEYRHRVDSGELSPVDAFVDIKREIVGRDFAILACEAVEKKVMSNVINLLRGDVSVKDDEEDEEEKEEETQIEEEVAIPVEYEDFGVPADVLREWSEEAQMQFKEREDYKQELILEMVKGRMYALVKAVKLQSWARMLPQRRKLLRHIHKKNSHKRKFFVAWRQYAAAERKCLLHVMGGPFWAWKDEVQDGKRLKSLVREFFNSCIKNLRLTPQAVMAFFAPEEWGNVLADHDKAKIRRLILVKLFVGWRKEWKFLSANRFKAGQLLSRMMRRTKGPLWVKEVNLVCFHMWKRFCGVQRAYRNEEPEPRYQTPFLPQWTKLLSLLTLKRIKKKRCHERGSLLTLSRQWSKWRYMMAVDRSKSLTPQAIAENHHRKKTLIKVFRGLYQCIRERGEVQRVQHRCFFKWKRFAPLQSRMRRCKIAARVWDGLCIQKRAFMAMQELCFDLIGTHATTLKVLRENLFNRKVLVCAYALLQRDVNVIFLECWRRLQLWWCSRARWKALKWQFRGLWYANRARNILAVWRQYATSRAINRQAGNEGSDDDDDAHLVLRMRGSSSAGGDMDSIFSQTDPSLGPLHSRGGSLDEGSVLSLSCASVSGDAVSIASVGGATKSQFIPLPPVLGGIACGTYDMMKLLRLEPAPRRPSALSFQVQCLAASRVQARQRRQREVEDARYGSALDKPYDPKDMQALLQRQVDNLDFEGVLAAIAGGAVVEAHHVQQVYKYIGENNLPLFNLLASNSPSYFIDRFVKGDRTAEILSIADPIKAVVVSSQAQRWERGKLSTRELSLIDSFHGADDEIYGWAGSLLLVRSVALMLFKRKISLLVRSCGSLAPAHTDQQEVDEIMKRKRLDRVYSAAKGVMLMMGVQDPDLSVPPAPPPLFQTVEVRHARQIDSWVKGLDIYALLSEYSEMTGKFSSEAKALRDPLVSRDDRLIRDGFMRFARSEFLALRRLCMTDEQKQMEREAELKPITSGKKSKGKAKKSKKNKKKKKRASADGASRPSTAATDGGEAGGGDDVDLDPSECESAEEGDAVFVDDGEPYALMNPNWGDVEIAEEREFYDRVGGSSGDCTCFYESCLAVRSPQWVTGASGEIAKSKLRSTSLNVTWRVLRHFLKSSDLFSEAPQKAVVERIAGIGGWLVLAAVGSHKNLRSIMQSSGLPHSWWSPSRILSMAVQEDLHVGEKVRATEEIIDELAVRRDAISSRRKTYAKFFNDTRSQVLAIAKKKVEKQQDDANQRNVRLRAVGPMQKEIEAINLKIESIKSALTRTQFLFAGGNYQGIYEAFGVEFAADLEGADNSALNIDCMHLVERKRQEIAELQAHIAVIEEKIGRNDHEVQYFDKLCERSTSWLQSLAKGKFDEMVEVQRLIQEGSEEAGHMESSLEGRSKVAKALRGYHEKLRNFIKALRGFLGVDVGADEAEPLSQPLQQGVGFALDEATFYDSSRPMTAVRSRPASPSDQLTMEFSSTLQTPSMHAPEPRMMSDSEVENMLKPVKPITPSNMKNRKEEMLRAEREAEAARVEAARMQQLAEMVERTKQEYWTSIVPPALKKARPKVDVGELSVVGVSAIGTAENVASSVESTKSELSSTRGMGRLSGGKTTKMWEKALARRLRDRSRGGRGMDGDLSDEDCAAAPPAPARHNRLSGFEGTSKGVWEVDMYVPQPSVSMRPDEAKTAASQHRGSVASASSKRAKEAPQDPFVLAGKATMLQVKEAGRRLDARAEMDELASAVSRAIRSNRSDTEQAAAEAGVPAADDDMARTDDGDDMTINTAEQEPLNVKEGSVRSVTFAGYDDLHTQTVVELADYPISPACDGFGAMSPLVSPTVRLGVPNLICYDGDGDDISMVSMEERPPLQADAGLQAMEMSSAEQREREMQLRHSLSIGSDVDDSVIMAPASGGSSVTASGAADSISLPDALSFVSISRGGRRSKEGGGRASPESQKTAEVIVEASLQSIFAAREPPPPRPLGSPQAAANSPQLLPAAGAPSLMQRLGLGLGGQLDEGSLDGLEGALDEGSLVNIVEKGLRQFSQEREASLSDFSQRLAASLEGDGNDEEKEGEFYPYVDAADSGAEREFPEPFDDEEGTLSPQRVPSKALAVVTENLLVLRRDAQDRPSYSSRMPPQDRTSFIRALYGAQRRKMRPPRARTADTAHLPSSVDGSSITGGSGLHDSSSVIPEDLLKKRPRRPFVRRTEQQLRVERERAHRSSQSLSLTGLQYVHEGGEPKAKGAVAAAAAVSRGQLLRETFDDFDNDSNLRQAYEIIFGSYREEDAPPCIDFDDEDVADSPYKPSLQQVISTGQQDDAIGGSVGSLVGVRLSSVLDESCSSEGAPDTKAARHSEKQQQQQLPPFNHVPTGTKIIGISVSKKEFQNQQNQQQHEQNRRIVDANVNASFDLQSTEARILSDLRQIISLRDSPRDLHNKPMLPLTNQKCQPLSSADSLVSGSMMDDMDERSIESLMRLRWQQKVLKQSKSMSNRQALDKYVAYGLSKQQAQSQSATKLPPLHAVNEAFVNFDMASPIDVSRVALGGGLKRRGGKFAKPNPRLAGLFAHTNPTPLALNESGGVGFELTGRRASGATNLSRSVSELPSNTTSKQLLQVKSATELALSFDYGYGLGLGASSVSDLRAGDDDEESSVVSAPRIEITKKKGKRM